VQRVFRSSGARPTWWAHWRHNLTIQAHLCRISSTQGQFSSFNLAMFHSHDFVTCIFKILQALWEDCKFIHYVWVRWFCLRNPEIFHSCSIHISLLLHHMIKPSKFSWQKHTIVIAFIAISRASLGLDLRHHHHRPCFRRDACMASSSSSKVISNSPRPTQTVPAQCTSSCQGNIGGKFITH